jgi:hypothetical protein
MSNVEAILREELARATVMLSERRNLLLAVAKELDHVGFVLADRFDEICEEVRASEENHQDGDFTVSQSAEPDGPDYDSVPSLPKEARR